MHVEGFFDPMTSPEMASGVIRRASGVGVIASVLLVTAFG
jgi:hypothetical protein